MSRRTHFNNSEDKTAAYRAQLLFWMASFLSPCIRNLERRIRNEKKKLIQRYSAIPREKNICYRQNVVFHFANSLQFIVVSIQKSNRSIVKLLCMTVHDRHINKGKQQQFHHSVGQLNGVGRSVGRLDARFCSSTHSFIPFRSVRCIFIRLVFEREAFGTKWLERK